MAKTLKTWIIASFLYCMIITASLQDLKSELEVLRLLAKVGQR